MVECHCCRRLTNGSRYCLDCQGDFDIIRDATIGRRPTDDEIYSAVGNAANLEAFIDLLPDEEEE